MIRAPRIAWLPLLLLVTAAADNPPASAPAASATVTVQYSEGDTVIDRLKEGMRFFLHRPPHVLQHLPAEMAGLPFTHRDGQSKATVKMHVPAGATVYLIIDSDQGANAEKANVRELNKQLPTEGWTRLADATLQPRQPNPAAIAIYRQTFSSEHTLSYPPTGFTDVVVAAAHLELGTVKDVSASSDNAAGSSTTASSDASPAATPIARRQTSIKTLYVLQAPSGMMLGHASDFILTANPGTPKGKDPTTYVFFTTPVGKEMHVVLDEAIRTVALQYPSWKATRVELSFEDKYTPKDGGSIGAAIGTLFLSMLRGFAIDPTLAMTGDLTVDGKIRAIGGVVAKIRGATDAHSAIVALPAENYDQVVDGMVYEGLPLITNVQVIGIPTLESAAALARTDRDPKLADAIATFALVQDSLKKSPGTLHSKETLDRLTHILEEAPDHFSARLLLLAAENKQPTRLSIFASYYYTNVAAAEVLPLIRQHARDRHVLASDVVEETLRKLGKVRLLADPAVYPLINALKNWVRTASDIESGRANPKSIVPAGDAVLDADTRLRTDRNIAEKMLSEGI